VGDTNHGAPIDAWLKTTHLGQHDGIKKSLTTVEVLSNNKVRDMAVDVYRMGSGKTTVSRTMHFGDPADVLYGVAKAGDDYGEYVDKRVFTRAIRTSPAQYVQLKVSKEEAGQPFRFEKLSAGFTLFKNRQ
jgi:hypothetical protein